MFHLICCFYEESIQASNMKISNTTTILYIDDEIQFNIMHFTIYNKLIVFTAK